MSESLSKKNVYQRLQEVASVVGNLQGTSKDRFGSKAIGIEDVENAIRDELTKHGLVTRWSNISIEQFEDGKGKSWLRRDRITVVNADNPEDCFVDEWIDVGSNPMAASSFVAKGYYKRLFHIVEDDDEGQAPKTDQRQRVVEPARSAEPPRQQPTPSATAQPPTAVTAPGTGDAAERQQSLVTAIRNLAADIEEQTGTPRKDLADMWSPALKTNRAWHSESEANLRRVFEWCEVYLTKNKKPAPNRQQGAHA